MEEGKPSAVKDSSDTINSAEENRTYGAATQNGEQAEEVRRAASIARRHSSTTSEPGKGAITPPEEPLRKRFQIPRKSKKALQPLSSESREFDELLKILHASFLEANSKTHFTYKSAQLVHNEFLEKEFTEKRRQLKFEGRLDKELAESYGFLLVDESQVNSICERGLLVGHSRLTTLGKPSMGVYLSKFADLLQANPLETGTTGIVFIFKVIKGKMKFVFDNFRNNQDAFVGNSNLDPAPKHECHCLKNMNAVISLLGYRAFERTQYYFYEYGFDEILKRPRHVCPYAVVSFGYKTDQMPRQSSSPLSGSVTFNSDRYNADRNGFILWRGQLLCNGKLLCFASLRSNDLFFPYKLPEKLELDCMMRLEQIKKRIPSLLFYKETHVKHKEVVKGGIYSRLCEVCDKTRTGNDFQRLLQKLEKEKLALVKPLPDRGFLFFYFPIPLGSMYGSQSRKPYPLHALFIYVQSRETLQPASRFKVRPTVMPENQDIMPEFMTFLGALHYAIVKAQSDISDNFNIVVEKHVRLYLKRREEGSYKHDYVLRNYEQGCDDKKNLFVGPREKSLILPVLERYLQGSDAYTLLIKRAKELIMENKRVQQFSPISDYEPMEDDHDNGTSMSRETVREVLPDNSYYDLDKVNSLLNLIQTRKKGHLETDDFPNSGVKRKLENSPEAQWKHPKYEDYLQQNSQESAHSLISALGGQDTDLRQENEEEIASEQLLADAQYCKDLFEKLSNSGLLDTQKLLAAQKVASDETSDVDVAELASTALDDSTHVESTDTAPDKGAHYVESTHVEPQSGNVPERGAVLNVPLADNDLVQNIDDGSDPLPVEDMIQGPYSGYASPCPSTPTEEIYRRQSSNSSNGENEMNWKLIPITGEEESVPEDHVEFLRDENLQGLSLAVEQSVYSPLRDTFPDDPRIHSTKKKGCGYSPLAEYQKGRRRSFQNERAVNSDQPTKKGHCFLKTKHCQNGVIENTVQEIYSSFSERLREVLREKDISYTAVTTPLLSSEERDVKLSDWLCAQASGIPVQHYIDELRVKLDSVVNSYLSSPEMGKPMDIGTEIEESLESHHGQEQNILNDHTPHSRDAGHLLDPLQSSEFVHNGCVEEESHNSILNIPLDGNPVPFLDPVPQSSQDVGIQDQEKIKSATPDITASRTDLTHLINQMNPEVFNNLVKIFTHVNKNIVKFYIHTEQEGNSVCEEIKNYLLKLGNVQCSPDQIVNCSTVSDKLLIIIQNEDIASSIHKIPSLITLKRQPCVSFAGVDSLDDLKNHTYNELFVSGGFIVSDDTVLNPDKISEDVLKQFLMFLEQIDNPDGKWQWKIHCKFQKKLKELGRLNPTAVNILTLLNTYQKKHLVEILAYHNCDSQTRQAPELDCLIRLQVQNIQQRHLIFLTEKDSSLFPSHFENGVLVTTMEEFMNNFTNLVGHHNSSNEEHCLSQLVNQEHEKAVNEPDLKEEEDDMSLDSEDEMPQIEVCTNTTNQESHMDCTVIQSEAVNHSQTEKSKKTPIIDPEFMQPVTPVSTAGSTTGDGNTTEESSSNFDYESRSLGISHFNLLTHQTFLGSLVYHNQTPVENFFISSYDQSADQETSPSSGWDQKWNVK